MKKKNIPKTKKKKESLYQYKYRAYARIVNFVETVR